MAFQQNKVPCVGGTVQSTVASTYAPPSNAVRWLRLIQGAMYQLAPWRHASSEGHGLALHFDPDSRRANVLYVTRCSNPSLGHANTPRAPHMRYRAGTSGLSHRGGRRVRQADAVLSVACRQPAASARVQLLCVPRLKSWPKIPASRLHEKTWHRLRCVCRAYAKYHPMLDRRPGCIGLRRSRACAQVICMPLSPAVR